MAIHFAHEKISRASTETTGIMEQRRSLISAVCACSYPVSDIPEAIKSFIDHLLRFLPLQYDRSRILHKRLIVVFLLISTWLLGQVWRRLL